MKRGKRPITPNAGSKRYRRALVHSRFYCDVIADARHIDALPLTCYIASESSSARLKREWWLWCYHVATGIRNVSWESGMT